MNIAATTTRPLPELRGLETRILLGPKAPFQPTRFVDLVPVNSRDTFGRTDSFASIDDAVRAARELSASQATPVAVVSGFMDFDFGNDPKNKPSYFLSQLKVARTGDLHGEWSDAPAGTRLDTSPSVTSIFTRDVSESRYVMYSEAIQAIVDGATELRRDASWNVLGPLPEQFDERLELPKA